MFDEGMIGVKELVILLGKIWIHTDSSIGLLFNKSVWHQPPRRSLAATMQDFAIDGLCPTGERAWQCCLAAQLEVVPSSSTVLIWISGDMRGLCDCKILSNSVVGCTSKFGFYGVVVWCWGKLRIPIGKPMRLSTTCERTRVQKPCNTYLLICIARSAFILIDVFCWEKLSKHIFLLVGVWPQQQEFEFQGYELNGPAADLFKAGASGRFPNNVKRDWFRKMGDMNHDHRVAWFLKLVQFHLIFYPKLCDILGYGNHEFLLTCWVGIQVQ